MEKVKHFEGNYIPYQQKEKLGLLNKMSNYTACGQLFDLKLKISLTEFPTKVTCPDCLKVMNEQKRKWDSHHKRIYTLE